MTPRRINIALALVFLALLCTAIAASYYKYVVLRDFESVFYVPCEEGEEGCFISLYDCEEGDDVADCAYVYKALIVNQGLLDDACVPDDGECLAAICSDSPEQCQTVSCNDPTASHYQLYDECAE
jgi:hypothetical protein